MAIRQVQWTAAAAVGAVLLLVFIRDHRVLSRYAYTLGLVGIVLVLIPALLPARYSEVNGAKLWVLIGGFSIQPGEFAKLALLSFFAYYLVRKREVLSLASRRFLGVDFPRGRDMGPVLVVWGLSLMVLVFEKDLGTSLMYFGMFVVTLYIATERSSWLIIGLGLFFGGAFLAWSIGEIVGGPFANFASRVDVWLHPFNDADDTGLQMVQSLLGLGTGGLFGTGPGNGLPYIPELERYVVPKVENDFVFAGIGEEIGLFGLSAVLVAYLLIVQRGLRIAVTVRDSFGKLLAGGLAFTLGLQVFVIVGGVTGLIPLTGQTTPFMSAGGSSLVANWLLLAVLLRIADAARRPVTVGQGGSIAPPAKLHEAPTEVVSVNGPLRKAGVVMMVLFGLLFAQLNWVQVVKADQYRTDVDHNRIRVQQAGVRAPARQHHRRRRVGRESTETRDTLKYLRGYPAKELYAHVVGYRPVNLAPTDIERMENQVLNGTADVFAADRLLEMFTGKKSNGGNVLLSLRKQVQETAYTSLLNNKTQSKIGAVVAIDPSTGGILALVSTPSYDPNPLVQHDFDASKAAYDKLAADPSKPLNNRALSETFPPGSTYKVIVSAAALQDGLDPGRRAHRRRQLHRAGYHHADPQLARCRLPEPDQAAGRAAGLLQHGVRPIRRGAARRGQAQGHVSGIRLRVQAVFAYRDDPDPDNAMNVTESHTGNIEAPDGSVDRPALAQSCIGQREVRWTPLQGALVAATVANDGNQMRPYLVDTVQDANLAPIWRADAVGAQPTDELGGRGAATPDDELGGH